MLASSLHGEQCELMPLRRKRDDTQQDVLFDSTRIDVVSVTADGSTVELYIVADALWTGSDEQIRSLQEKIHNYVVFATDGRLAATYAEATGLPWRIVLDCQSGTPDERTADVLARTAGPVQRYGGELVVKD